MLPSILESMLSCNIHHCSITFLKRYKCTHAVDYCCSRISRIERSIAFTLHQRDIITLHVRWCCCTMNLLEWKKRCMNTPVKKCSLLKANSRVVYLHHLSFLPCYFVMGILDIVPTGVITGDDVLKLFNYAQEHAFAIPSVNVTSTR